MSRVKGITKPQERFDAYLTELEAGTTDIKTCAPDLAETMSHRQPEKGKWEFTVGADGELMGPFLPVRTTRKRIEFLKSLRAETTDTKTCAALDEVLESLTSKPESWAKQLKLQARYEDDHETLKSLLEQVNAIVVATHGKPDTKPAAREQVANLHAIAEPVLERMVEVTCKKCSENGFIAYATAEQRAFLEGAKLLFKRARFTTRKGSRSRVGGAYFYLMDHIRNAGLLEDQDFYRTGSVPVAHTE